jgi:hypothetical protein
MFNQFPDAHGPEPEVNAEPRSAFYSRKIAKISIPFDQCIRHSGLWKIPSLFGKTHGFKRRDGMLIMFKAVVQQIL